MADSEYQRIHESALQPLDTLLRATVGPLIRSDEEYNWIRCCQPHEFPLPFVVSQPRHLSFQKPDSHPVFELNAQRAIRQFVRRFEDVKSRLDPAYRTSCENNWPVMEKMGEMLFIYVKRFATEYDEYTMPVTCPIDSQTGNPVGLALVDVDWYLEIMYKQSDDLQTLLRTFGNQILPERYKQWVNGIVVHPLFPEKAT